MGQDSVVFEPSPWQRTKIVCTLGPATDQPEVLEQLIRAGMDVARINASHGDHASHARRIEAVRQAAKWMGEPVAILLDLPGPKFRVGELAGGHRELERGAKVTLKLNGEASDCIPILRRELLQALRPGEAVYLADGTVELGVEEAGSGVVVCRVITGGTIRSRSGINLPESELPALVPTEEDRRHISFAAAQQVEWVGVSFVQTADDLARVRALFPDESRPSLIAKIEKRQALAGLDAIIQAADGVMVARGDLGVETDLAEIPLVQKRIIAQADALGRPVITATQMLESMVEQRHPTRAEVTDVANAVLDGTDAVMLSAESAIGRYPVMAAQTLNRVLLATEAEFGERMALERLQASRVGDADDPLSFVACQLAGRIGARAIIAPVSEMGSAQEIARFRPNVPLVAVTGSESLARRLAMVWGVSPLLAPADTGPENRIHLAGQWLFERRLARTGDTAVVLSCSRPSAEMLDTLRVVRLED